MVYVELAYRHCQTCGHELESDDPFNVWLCECNKDEDLDDEETEGEPNARISDQRKNQEKGLNRRTD